MITVLAYAAIYLIWGSTFLAIRIAIATIPPILMMGIRCVSAGALLVAVAALRGERPRWRAWGDATVAGALMFGGPYAALAWSEQRLSSGMAALLVATLPFWLALIEWMRGSRPSARALVGLTVGLFGVALLVGGGLTMRSAAWPMAAIIIGELAWATGSVVSQPRLPKSLLLNAGMPLAAGGALLLLFSLAVGESHRFDPHAVSGASLAALAYLTIFGSIVAFSAYMFLLGVAPASRVGTHAYVNPLIAVALGAGLAGERITASIGIAAVLIAAGVALVLGAKSRQRPPTSLSSTPRRVSRRRRATLVPELVADARSATAGRIQPPS
ncbi:MAG TPA: EamA family transporter [Vicinamibacterales bacterium]|jgi:drug/metabolite transporter (DMT)-like permease